MNQGQSLPVALIGHQGRPRDPCNRVTNRIDYVVEFIDQIRHDIDAQPVYPKTVQTHFLGCVRAARVRVSVCRTRD